MYELEKVLNYYGIYLKSLKQNIVCPFHADINASLAIDVEKNSCFCFGCGFKGNAFDFVKEMETQYQYNDLQCSIIYSHITKNCEKAKTELIEKPTEPNGDLYLTAYNYFNGLPKVDWTITNFPEKEYLFNRGFTPETLNDARAKINKCSHAYPIIFPILDNGKFKGWVCRTDKKDIEKKRKYLYNTGFRRTNTLCGNYDGKCIPIICEGYLDRLKIIQAGYKYPIAILGWKIAKEQISKLKAKGIENVVSFLDSDEPGIKGTRYLSEHFNVKRVKYPDGVKDPGELESKQINKMLNAINYIE